MTTILAIAREDRTWMAADAMTNVYERPVYGARKIRRPAPGVLIAATGDGAACSLLERGLTLDNLPTSEPADLQQWAEAVALAVTDIYVGHALIDDGRMDGNVLLAVAGHVWTVVHQQAIYHPDGVAALGSGEGPAIGAAHALLDSGDSPLIAAQAALSIASRMDKHTGGPIAVECLGPT